MQKLRESLAIILVTLLPFHAFLVTVGTKMIAGPGHAPLMVLSLWKEVVLFLMLGIAAIEIIKCGMQKSECRIGIDRIDVLIIALIILSLIVTGMTHGDWKLYAYGFKYDFVPLVAFMVLRRVSWSEGFLRRACIVLLGAAGIVAFYGMISMYLPQSFFVWLGYSDLHSLYLSDGPLAAFQQIGGSALRRIQSTMSGPNQLGLWLLLPLSIVLTQRTRVSEPVFTIGMFVLVALLMSLSRSAVVGAGVIVTLLLWKRLPRKKFWRAAGAVFVSSLVLFGIVYALVPDIAVRAASTRDHISRPLAAVRTIISHPLGLGLGTAGPASNRVSDTCVYLSEGDDPSWASVHPNLCVFVGGTQVQPADRVCQCPFLPEDWYLQVGVELGVLGLLLYLYLTGVTGYWLLVTSKTHLCAKPIFLSFLGISIAALFLHAWEDSAVAYSIWILCAVYLPSRYLVANR